MNLQGMICLGFLISGFIVHVQAMNVPNLTCFECNTYRGGTGNACNEKGATRHKQGCTACMKVHTRTEMHDYWTKPRAVVFESFTCVAKDFSIKPAGCYMTTGSRSVTKSCFCYTNLCNYATRNDISIPIMTLVILHSLVTYIKEL